MTKTCLLASLLFAAAIASAFAEDARKIPAPAADETAGQATSEVAVLAGGCFWGVQGVFQHVDGVSNAVSGYAGGKQSTAHYEMVSEGTTGHAESVQLNRQGPDTGTQYRSAIFPTSAEQARIAESYIAQLQSAHSFDRPIVTKIEPDHPFFPAEEYHQDYLTRHPNQLYIVINDLPKVANLKHEFPALYRNEPVLVSAARATN